MLPYLTESIKSFWHGATDPPAPLSLSFDRKSIEWYKQASDSTASTGRAWSGESVNAATAQNLSVVWACERIISESIAFLPLSLMRSTETGKYAQTDHPAYSLLHDSPNEEMTAMGFRETLTAHVVMGGNCFAQIIRRGGTGSAVEMYPLAPSQVKIDRNREGRLIYVVSEKSQPDKTYTVERGRPHDILHVRGLGSDGVRGYSVLAMARQSIGTAMAAEKYAGRFFANGGRLPYQLKLAQKFKSDSDAEKFRHDWDEQYSDPHKAIILEPWLTYESIGMSQSDAQLLETRQFSIPEICRWFLISPHMVGDLSRATFSNIEHLALQFVKMTLTAWLVRWEQELWRCVLTPTERSSGYYWKHNVNGLLRGDFASRMAGYASALQNGHKNIDEVRDLEDENPLPNGAGEAHHIQLNMATVPGTGQPMVAEQGILDRMAAKKPQGGINGN